MLRKNTKEVRNFDFTVMTPHDDTQKWAENQLTIMHSSLNFTEQFRLSSNEMRMSELPPLGVMGIKFRLNFSETISESYISPIFRKRPACSFVFYRTVCLMLFETGISFLTWFILLAFGLIPHIVLFKQAGDKGAVELLIGASTASLILAIYFLSFWGHE